MEAKKPATQRVSETGALEKEKICIHKYANETIVHLFTDEMKHTVNKKLQQIDDTGLNSRTAQPYAHAFPARCGLCRHGARSFAQYGQYPDIYELPMMGSARMEIDMRLDLLSNMRSQTSSPTISKNETSKNTRDYLLWP